MKKYFLSFIIFLCCILTSCGRRNDFDETILKTANEVLTYADISNTSVEHFEVTANSDGSYTVILTPKYSEPQTVLLPEKSPYNKLNFRDDEKETPDKRVKSIVSSSKKKVLQYIDSSSIIKNHTDVKNFIKNIETFVVPTEDVAVYDGGTIYISKFYNRYVCEWMVCHELVHAISDYTNKGIENERYACFLFDEVLTDIIASSMEPDISDDIVSGYQAYYDIVYSYIGIFGQEALEAYYYGYDNILVKVNPADLDFFILSIENVDYSEFAWDSICATLGNWKESVAS